MRMFQLKSPVCPLQAAELAITSDFIYTAGRRFYWWLPEGIENKCDVSTSLSRPLFSVQAHTQREEAAKRVCPILISLHGSCSRTYGGQCHRACMYPSIMQHLQSAETHFDRLFAVKHILWITSVVVGYLFGWLFVWLVVWVVVWVNGWLFGWSVG